MNYNDDCLIVDIREKTHLLSAILVMFDEYPRLFDEIVMYYLPSTDLAILYPEAEFWEEKANKDFGTSLKTFRRTRLSPVKRYLQIRHFDHEYQKKKCLGGPDLLVKQALDRDDPDILKYALGKGGHLPDIDDYYVAMRQAESNRYRTAVFISNPVMFCYPSNITGFITNRAAQEGKVDVIVYVITHCSEWSWIVTLRHAFFHAQIHNKALIPQIYDQLKDRIHSSYNEWIYLREMVEEFGLSKRFRKDFPKG
jgi:hypothetical protein